MERVSRYRDCGYDRHVWTVRRFSPLTIVWAACLAMAVVGIIYVCANPAVDAGMLAGR